MRGTHMQIQAVFKLLTGASVLLMLTGCAKQGVQEVDPNATHYMMHYEMGQVISIRPVVIKDDGTGTFIGAITGIVLGSMVGRGNGTTLATLLGGLGGAYAGNQLGKANAQELTVNLQSGDTVVVIVKGEKFKGGEQVRIVQKNSKVVSVEPY
jgi:outer membrane lipoprotein SlyB